MKSKKALSALSAILIGVSSPSIPLLCNNLTSIVAHAGSGTTSDGFVYVFDEKTKEVTIASYKGNVASVVVPAYIEGMPVTKIQWYAFEKAASMVSVSLPDTLKEIEPYSFDYLKNLKSVTIPSSVNLIGQRAFCNCTGLESVTIKGATELDSNVFSNCTALKSVTLSDECKSYKYASSGAFVNCPNLYTVNGVPAYSMQKNSDGTEEPVLNPNITQAVRNNFSKSVNVGFVNDYCTDLCNYIVATETDPWMNDALKARQLHDWLIYHCEYEDRKNGESTQDIENHVASSVFLSYAINERGEGVGETVCDGFAKAYTMLLSAADIESYYVGHSLHVWNFVKIDGKYYTVDVTNDNSSYNSLKNKTPYSTYYGNFLSCYQDEDAKQTNCTDHPLLKKYTNDISSYLMTTTRYSDSNFDGILDYDYDLDGNWLQYDFVDDINAYNGFLQFAFPSGADNRMDEVVYNLHQRHQSFWEYLNTNGPKSQTAKPFTNVNFSVSLFGDNLSYQWQYLNNGTNKWENLTTSTGAKTPVLTEYATSFKNGMRYRCVVTNSKGQTAASCEAVLTVK